MGDYLQMSTQAARVEDYISWGFLLKMKTQQKGNNHLRKKIPKLQKRININFQYCKLQPDIFSLSSCRFDERLLKKQFGNCQNLKPKRDCLEQRESDIMMCGTSTGHELILKIVLF